MNKNIIMNKNHNNNHNNHAHLNNILQNFIQILLTSIIPAIIAFFCYNRLFIGNLQRDIIFPVDLINLIAFIISFITLAVCFYITAKKLKLIVNKESKYMFIEKIKLLAKQIRAMLYIILIEFYEMCWYFIEKITHCDLLRYHFMHILTKIILWKIHNVRPIFLILSHITIMLTIAPRIIFTLAFVYDVHAGKFVYMYKVLPYLLIPLVIMAIHYMFKHFYSTHIEKILKDTFIKENNYVLKHSVKLPSFIKTREELLKHYLLIFDLGVAFYDYEILLSGKYKNLWVLYFTLLIRLFFFLCAIIICILKV